MTTDILTFLSLTFLQVILMIDNLIFISVLTENLSIKDKDVARKYGLIISLVLNAGLVFLATYLTSLHTELFKIFDYSFTIHNLILLLGGIFLLVKVVKEIRCKIDGVCDSKDKKVFKNLSQVVINMALIDLIFSIDSAIISVGMTNIKWIQITSILLAILVMYFSFNSINRLTDKYPSLKVLSLTFLFLIGFSLLSSGLGVDIPKGYVYFAMFFSLLVEFLNIKIEKLNK
jgi:predicted tellurium resistance membrane protein TerC